MQRSGHADLPLHGGRVPPWLAQRMEKLGTAIVESVLQHYGAPALLSRLSDPHWFQALGCVMGMDWHSSGITTSVMGALKRGLSGRSHELGLYICGGRGKQSRRTPEEILVISEREGFDGDALTRISRLTARVDNNAIADGFQIYLHNFVVTVGGEWAVIQQGMNTRSKLARRYHWHSAGVRDFTCEPHTAIVGQHQGEILNLVDGRAGQARNVLLTIVAERPEATLNSLRRLAMPARHHLEPGDVDLKRLGAVLSVSYERQYRDFASLLLQESLGPRTLQSLALVAEVIHGAPVRFSDPARFSFAHGGKDGHPFPVPLKTYDETLAVLRRALEQAKIDGAERGDALRRLDKLVNAVARKHSPVADFHRLVAHEHTISRELDGRTVHDDKTKKLPARRPNQLALF